MADFSVADPKNNSYRLLWMLGLALSLPMILLSGPLAGYLLSIWLVKQFNVNAVVTPLFMVLGLLGSGWQTVQLIRRLNRNQTKNP